MKTVDQSSDLYDKTCNSYQHSRSRKLSVHGMIVPGYRVRFFSLHVLLFRWVAGLQVPFRAAESGACFFLFFFCFPCKIWPVGKSVRIHREAFRAGIGFLRTKKLANNNHSAENNQPGRLPLGIMICIGVWGYSVGPRDTQSRRDGNGRQVLLAIFVFSCGCLLRTCFI